MASKRRYKVADFPTYSNTFDRLRVQSPILNANANQAGVNMKLLFTKRELEVELELLQNDKQAIETRLQLVEEKFTGFQQRQINLGKRKPEEMPPELGGKADHRGSDGCQTGRDRGD